jgi:hypothetical protein
MNESPTFEGLTDEALEEHQQIHFYLDQVTQTLQRPAHDSASADSMARLAAQIEGLKERLIEHQQLEEQGGLFQAVVAALPASRVEVERLMRQHGRMIEILEMARLHAHGAQAAQVAPLRTDLEQFIQMFRKHELDEESLLARAIDKEREKEGKALD